MKKLLLLPLIAISFIAKAQTTAIPDANFEQALINLGLDNVIDGGVLTANINGETALSIIQKGILDLTGIEDFSSLTVLDCSNNELTALDVSQNNLLTSLSCSSNELSTLDLTLNTDLEILNCSSNGITALDLSQNSALNQLYCENNLLNCLNVKNGNNLNVLYFYATSNSSLNCIEVDNVTYSNTNWYQNVPCGFNTNCNNSCSSITSINETALNTFELYPNPTTSSITLNNLQLGDEVSVYNTLGQRVYSSKVSAVTLSINLSELGNNGIYFVRVNNISERVLLGR